MTGIFYDCLEPGASDTPSRIRRMERESGFNRALNLSQSELKSHSFAWIAFDTSFRDLQFWDFFPL
jgi:hypothetical protein